MIGDENKKVHIAYMVNPDKVFYSMMDDKIISHLENEGAKVTKVSLEDISFLITDKIQFLSNNEILEIDGFLSYGHMSEFHQLAYAYITQSLYSMGIPTLHDPEVERTLNNKYLQGLAYVKNQISVPQTSIAFTVPAYKETVKTYYPEWSVVKKLSDYGGDGVSIHSNMSNCLNYIAKTLWKNEYTLCQQIVKDSPGKSIRVLVIGGKPVACAEFNDKTGNLKSNNNYGTENFSLDSKMNDEKLNDYFALGLKATQSFGVKDLTIGGVDILDSKEKGLLVLETNPWPDIYDTQESVGLDLFTVFAKVFYQKVLSFKLKKGL